MVVLLLSPIVCRPRDGQARSPLHCIQESIAICTYHHDCVPSVKFATPSYTNCNYSLLYKSSPNASQTPTAQRNKTNENE